ncbi:hypothetical protein F2Q69_00006910 [Brassica cretica]|uniref:Uncharacterized protein n=1 Tax=Brassica cretica TaxID=69181 RepID=A0A8S9P9W5_BRACR|nr:hypothetical protein F2Q69_00006910 [Brassica cretica]
MTRPDLPSDDESPVTEGAPTAAAFAETILKRMAQQDAVQKATTEQLTAIAAILAPLAGSSGDPATTTRAKHKWKKSNLVIVDVSKSSSHDQILPRMKKRTNRSTTHTRTPASDQMRTSGQKGQTT